jgi:hypothetical protein
MALELGNTVYATQLRVEGAKQGSYLRLQIGESFVWYAATTTGFEATDDVDATYLENEFQRLFDEQVKELLQ